MKSKKERERGRIYSGRAHNSSDQSQAHSLRAARRTFFISISSAWDLGRTHGHQRPIIDRPIVLIGSDHRPAAAKTNTTRRLRPAGCQLVTWSTIGLQLAPSTLE